MADEVEVVGVGFVCGVVAAGLAVGAVAAGFAAGVGAGFAAGVGAVVVEVPLTPAAAPLLVPPDLAACEKALLELEPVTLPLCEVTEPVEELEGTGAAPLLEPGEVGVGLNVV